MPTLLQLDSSMDLRTSVSRALTARFADAWRAAGPGHRVVHRDLHTDPLPHLPSKALHWAPELRTPDESAATEAEELQRTLIGEVAAADAVVIGAPMYNWSMPSTLKAWIDHLHVPGTTSTFDAPNQPFAGKPVVVVSSRGDAYGPGTANPDVDFVLPALRQVLGAVLGMRVLEVTAQLTLARRIPALQQFAEQGEESLRRAQAEVDRLAAELAAGSDTAG